MERSKIIIYSLTGGVLGFAIHLVWHFSTKTNLFSIGPHAISGTIYTLIGVFAGAVFYLIIYRK